MGTGERSKTVSVIKNLKSMFIPDPLEQTRPPA